MKTLFRGALLSCLFRRVVAPKGRQSRRREGKHRHRDDGPGRPEMGREPENADVTMAVWGTPKARTAPFTSSRFDAGMHSHSSDMRIVCRHDIAGLRAARRRSSRRAPTSTSRTAPST